MACITTYKFKMAGTRNDPSKGNWSSFVTWFVFIALCTLCCCLLRYKNESSRKLHGFEHFIDKTLPVQPQSEVIAHQIIFQGQTTQMEEAPSVRPEVAWIMSYGASGTSFTITNTEKMTNLSTASNYGRDYIPCESIDPRGQGPFIRSVNKPLPKNFIMTKTHCGGYCIECSPTYYIHTEQSFEIECRTGQKRRPKGTIMTTTYSPDIPKRAIHLIRNPFDTLIGRMHLQMKHLVTRNVTNNNNNTSGNVDADYDTFTDDADGLAAWCRYLDRHYRDEDLKAFSKDYVAKYIGTVPCHSEWFRFIQWHNHAYRVHERISPMPVHYMYYENYTTNFYGSVQAMFEFMKFPKETLQNEPLVWIAGKSYLSFYSKRHISEATKMVRELAHPKVWTLIKHYFDTQS